MEDTTERIIAHIAALQAAQDKQHDKIAHLESVLATYDEGADMYDITKVQIEMAQSNVAMIDAVISQEELRLKR